jgi:hypothetical protein
MKNKMDTEEYKSKSRLTENNFIRERKLGFKDILSLVLCLIRKSTQLEIDNFLDTFLGKSINIFTYSKQAFSKARQNITVQAFTLLNDEIISNYYSDNDFKKYKEWRLIGCDGSRIEIPNTEETQNYFGYAENQHKLKTARALALGLYDLENEIMISSTLGHYNDSERELAEICIEKMLQYDNSNIRNLIVFDRGYPSFKLIMYLNSINIDFVMRTNINLFKEYENMKTEDEIVDFEIKGKRKWDLKGKHGLDIGEDSTLQLRVLKVILKSGECEMLITNVLEKEKLLYNEIVEIYGKRWGIETSFDELKNKLEIENFSGKKPIVIKQDFHATILIYNIAALFKNEAEDQLKENRGKTQKYDYKINKNVLFSKVRYKLIKLILEPNRKKKEKMFDNILIEIKHNIVPIRKNRNNPRDKSENRNKYSQNNRRCL